MLDILSVGERVEPFNKKREKNVVLLTGVLLAVETL